MPKKASSSKKSVPKNHLSNRTRKTAQAVTDVSIHPLEELLRPKQQYGDFSCTDKELNPERLSTLLSYLRMKGGESEKLYKSLNTPGISKVYVLKHLYDVLNEKEITDIDKALLGATNDEETWLNEWMNNYLDKATDSLGLSYYKNNKELQVRLKLHLMDQILTHYRKIQSDRIELAKKSGETLTALFDSINTSAVHSGKIQAGIDMYSKLNNNESLMKSKIERKGVESGSLLGKMYNLTRFLSLSDV